MTDKAALPPNPRMTRARWTDLCGQWEFCYDDDNVGLAKGWGRGESAFDARIEVPYPPESTASGIGDKSYHPIVWYRRAVEVPEMAEGDRLILNFGAVDYAARVWLNGALVASHEGGHTPFHADVTDALVSGDSQILVVRAEDPPRDVRIPRGKQDWQERPHTIWYDRTTGIWQPVWMSVVPALHVTDLAFVPDLPNARVRCELRLSAAPGAPVPLRIRLTVDGATLAEQVVMVDDSEAEFDIAVPALRHGTAREGLLWSPERPRLVDAEVTLEGENLDRIESYLGLRSVDAAEGRFLLNDRPYFLRFVLGQNYWPDSHLAASAEELKAEVEHIKGLGFNGVRIHQKIENPQFLYWCDVLGVMVWEEMPSAYAFSASAVERLVREWTEVIRRDKGHPCIVAWVPMNESWGITDMGRREDQRSYARALYHLTKALDSSRPVISNDGWELVETDIVSVHDYAPTGEGLRERYGEADQLVEVLRGWGAPGRRMLLDDPQAGDRPVMLTEFGGLSYAPEKGADWHGYATVEDAAAFEDRLDDLLAAIAETPLLSGYCYTQLTDTLQEVNGLLNDKREPKLPVETLRRIMTRPAPIIPAELVDAERRAARAKARGESA